MLLRLTRILQQVDNVGHLRKNFDRFLQNSICSSPAGKPRGRRGSSNIATRHEPGVCFSGRRHNGREERGEIGEGELQIERTGSSVIDSGQSFPLALILDTEKRELTLKLEIFKWKPPGWGALERVGGERQKNTAAGKWGETKLKPFFKTKAQTKWKINNLCARLKTDEAVCVPCPLKPDQMQPTLFFHSGCCSRC